MRPFSAIACRSRLAALCLLVLGVGPTPLSAQTRSRAATPASRASAAKPAETAPILLRFQNGKTVTAAEFERVYLKNYGTREQARGATPAELREYLDLFVAFRRKVMLAEAEGLDTTRAFRDELQGYLSQLAATFLIERRVLDRLTDEALERDNLEATAAHLLLNCPPTAAPADTQRIVGQLLSIRDSIVRGVAPFEVFARRHSQDPSARLNGGELGTFSVLDMVYPFEQAAFTTPVGAISAPVRTRFGYHLVWVRRREPKPALRKAAHLFVSARGDSAVVSRAKVRIDSLRRRIDAGVPFAELCACCSDDKASAQNGGDLGSVRLLSALEDVKRRLSPGQVSQPIRSAYGWHLLTVGPDETPRPEADRRRELRQRIARDERARLAEQALVERLLREYKYSENAAAITQLAQQLGPRYAAFTADSLARLAPATRALTLAQFADRTLTAADLLAFKAQTPAPRMGSLDAADPAAALSLLSADLGRLVHREVLKYEEAHLADKYPDYALLAQEYRDGLLLFSVMDRRAWRKAVDDTLGQRAYYDAHPDRFQSGPRLQQVELQAADSATLAAQAATLLASGAYTPAAGAGLSIEWSPEPEQLQALRSRSAARCQPLRRAGERWLTTCAVAELPPARLPFAEAHTEVVRLYQQQLEAQLLTELERRFPVTTDDAVLQKLFR